MMSFWVVPDSARAGDPLLLGSHLVEREEPHRRRVDGHGGVHGVQRDAVDQRPHVAQVRDRNPDLAHLAPRQRVVGVVAGLGGEVEGHRQTGLALGQVGAEQGVGGARGGVSRVGAHHPGLVTAAALVHRGASTVSRCPAGAASPSILPVSNQAGQAGRASRSRWRTRCRRVTASSRSTRGLGSARTSRRPSAWVRRCSADEHSEPDRVDHLDRGAVDDEVTGRRVERGVERETYVRDRRAVQPRGERAADLRARR